MGRKLVFTAILFSSCLLFISISASPREANATVPHDSWTILASPGDTVGATHYDYQANGSTGTRIVKDYLGGFHFTWMNGIDFWSGNRWIYYNFLDENGVWRWPNVGTQVNSYQGAGFPQIDALGDDRAAVAYHSASNAKFVCVAIDITRGFGAFTEYDAPDDEGLLPYIAVDRTDRVHIIYSGGEQPWDPFLFYTRFDLENWTEPEVVDSLVNYSAVIVSSDVSDRVAIVYTTRDPDDPDQIVDVFYIESEDGTNWNWNEKINITNYQPEDTIRASTDLDAVYDNGDNLHIIWNTPVWSPPPDNGWGKCLLWHWSEQTGITFLADGSWNSYPPHGNLTISKMSIGVDNNDDLFAVWSQFDTLDVSAGGYSNGELYMSYSTDGGLTWSEPENITNSPTPGCWPEECDCDIWPSLAEEVDAYLHIVYLNDKDAGSAVHYQGVDTENPILYLKVENPTREADVPEAKTTGPLVTTLFQNYPNPFNTSTSISYQLAEPGNVRLDVYNLAGQLMETLVDSHQEPGYKTVTWDGSHYSSGIYFCRLTVDDFCEAKRIILMK